MIKNLVFVCLVFSLIFVQSCINEISCTVQQNNQVVISYSSTMPYIIYDFVTQPSASFSANLSKNKIIADLEKANGALVAYKAEKQNDKGLIELTAQLPSFIDAKELLEQYGITFNYSLQTRNFEWNFKPMQAFVPSELSDFASLIITPFSQTVRVTLPYRTIKAQNGTVNGSTAVFTNVFISLNDFFSSSVYTITW